MELSDIALRTVGAFYAFAGVVATRAAIMSAFLDHAIAKISLESTSTRETLRTWWLFITSPVIFLGGLALAVQLEIAQWLFVFSALGQAAYLAVVAPMYFDTEDPPDGKGRKGTINAFALYLAATAFVLWAGQHDRLTAFKELQPPAATIAGAVLAAYLWYLASTAWKTIWPASQSFADAPDVEDSKSAYPAPFDAAAVTQVKVMADYQCDPLWSLDDNYWNFPADALGVSDRLAGELADWAEQYERSLNPENPQNSGWSEAQFRQHRDEGRTLAMRLKRERPDLMVYAWEPDAGVVEVHDD